MATVKGVNRTAIDALKPSEILDAVQQGKVHCYHDEYVALGTETAGTLIEMCDELPVGAKVIDTIISNGDTTATLKVGDLEDDDRYNASVAAGAVEHLDCNTGAGYEVDMTTASTPDNQIVLTTAGATLTINKVIRVAVLFTMPS